MVALIVYVPAAVAAKARVYVAPAPDRTCTGASPSCVTVIAYQLAMWLAVSEMESTEPRIAPLAGLAPRNWIGGGGGGGGTQAVPSGFEISGRMQWTGPAGGVGGVPPTVTGRLVKVAAACPPRFLIA